MKVEVQGHTDSVGSKKLNMKLSKKRAKAVAECLVSKGIPKRRLVPRGYGPAKPFASNKTRKARRANRRVELNWLD